MSAPPMTNHSTSKQQYEAFLALFTGHRENLFRYIFTLLPSHADAEDVFQRCSLILWRKFSEFDSERSFFTWACGVARYEIQNFLRNSRRQKMKFDSELVTQLSDYRTSELESPPDTLKHLNHCLKSLLPKEQELIRIAYHEEKTLKEFAETTGQALQTLYNNLGRLRRRLLDCVRRKQATEALS